MRTVSGPLRAQQAYQQENFYRLSHPKPLTQDEVNEFKRRIEDGTVAEAVAALKDIGKFGGRASEGAARQLGEHSEFTAHVAGMFAHGGVSAQTAEDIIRGRREIKDNKAGAADMLKGAGEGGTIRKFNAYVVTR